MSAMRICLIWENAHIQWTETVKFITSKASWRYPQVCALKAMEGHDYSRESPVSLYADIQIDGCSKAVDRGGPQPT